MAPSRRTKRKTAATATGTGGGTGSGGGGGGGSGSGSGVSGGVSVTTATVAAVPVVVEGAEEAHTHTHDAQANVTSTSAAAADPVVATAEGRPQQEDDERATEERCPACKEEVEGATNEVAGDKETWIQCDACKTWFHWNCAGNGGDAQQVDKWSVPASLLITFFLSFGT